MQNLKYVSSLESYLAFSKEDTINVNAILQQMPRYTSFEILRKKDPFRILDVGSGNGAKAIYLARSLAQKGVRVKVDSVEPKKEQRERLIANYSREPRLMGKVFDAPLEEVSFQESYECILMIHSLYEFPRNEDGTLQSLEKIPLLLDEGGFGVVIIENAAGDFQKLKRELYPYLNKREPVSEESLRRTFEACRFFYRQGELCEFTFEIPDFDFLDEVQLGMRLSFLFSDSLKSRELSDAEMAAVGRWVREHIRRDQKRGPSLWTPDSIFWLYGQSFPSPVFGEVAGPGSHVIT